MASLTGTTVEGILGELKGRIYYNPAVLVQAGHKGLRSVVGVQMCIRDRREKHVERPLRPLGISEARHPVMPGRESQVLEFVALVHVEDVYKRQHEPFEDILRYENPKQPDTVA